MPRLAWPSIRILSLSLPDKLESSVFDLIEQAGVQVKELALSSRSSAPELAKALQFLSHPENLEKLLLDFRPGKKWSFPPDVRTLFHLRRLCLRGKWQLLGSDSWRNLQDLPEMVEIIFERGSDLNVEQWTSMLDSTDFRFLQTLRLDNVFAQAGDLTCNNFYDPRYYSLGFRAGVHEDVWELEGAIEEWRRARWTAACSRAGVERLQTAAKSRHLSLVGSTIEASKLENDLDYMEAQLEEVDQCVAEQQRQPAQYYFEEEDAVGCYGNSSSTDEDWE